MVHYKLLLLTYLVRGALRVQVLDENHEVRQQLRDGLLRLVLHRYSLSVIERARAGDAHSGGRSSPGLVSARGRGSGLRCSFL